MPWRHLQTNQRHAARAETWNVQSLRVVVCSGRRSARCARGWLRSQKRERLAAAEQSAGNPATCSAGATVTTLLGVAVRK